MQKTVFLGIAFFLELLFAAAARAHVPIDTGELKKHIVDLSSRPPNKDTISRAILVRKIRKISKKSYERMRLKGKRVYFAGYSSSGKAQISAFYGYFIEYGTIKMRARPFMRPAVNRAKGYMKEILEKHISAVNNAIKN